jgi:FAD/FMN-containing dehydrogenase
VTLKVAPLPREERGVVGSFARCEAACDAALRLASSPLFPLATTLHDQGAAHRIREFGGGVESAAWTLVVRCGGTRAAAVAQEDAVSGMLRLCGASKVEALDADRLHFAWSDIAELAGGAMYSGMQYLCCTISSLPSHVPALLAGISAAFIDAQCTAHPVSGVVYAHAPVAAGAAVHSDAGAVEFIRPALQTLFDLCERERFTLTFLAAPPSLGRGLRAPIPADTPIGLMRRVKATFDPSGTFDPGRFIGGI